MLNQDPLLFRLTPDSLFQEAPVNGDIRGDLNAASERLSPILEAGRGGNADAKA